MDTPERSAGKLPNWFSLVIDLFQSHGQNLFCEREAVAAAGFSGASPGCLKNIFRCICSTRRYFGRVPDPSVAGSGRYVISKKRNERLSSDWIPGQYSPGAFRFEDEYIIHEESAIVQASSSPGFFEAIPA